MNMTGYHGIAILLATLLSVAVGMIWYAPPVFGRRWQQITGSSNPGKQALAVWVLCYLALAITVAYLFKNIGVSGLYDGVRWGSTFGLVVSGLSVAPNYAFGKKPLALFLIETGYVVVALTVMGAVIGAWQ